MRAAVLRTACFALVCGALAACASRPSTLPVAASPDGAADTERVLVATSRTPDSDLTRRFSGERSDRLSFLDIAVSVPRNRDVGEVIEPRDPPDPAKQFVANGVDVLAGEAAFVAAVNADMATRPPGDRVVFVFVHGYNVQFAAGVYRHAQLRRDYGFRALPVHYSWPSAGRLPAYLYDRDSVQFSRDGLLRTLVLLEQSQAERIFLVAHSMGTLLAMETLRQASLSGNTRLLQKIESVVLAAPDIDEDVFRTQIAEVQPLPKPFVILVSAKDRALRVSKRVRGGHPRVGEGQDIGELQQAGAVVIDLTDIEDAGDRIQHSTFASSPSLIRMVDRNNLNRAILRRSGEGRQSVLEASLGGLSDFAADAIYLPAQVAGVR